MATEKHLLCDTNILLDIFDPQRQCHAHAIALLMYMAENSSEIKLVAPISSFKDAYYVLTRLYRDEPQARDSIGRIMGRVVEPLDLLAAYGTEALASDEPDFEDALVVACAEHEHVDVIITRDTRAFATCGIPTMDAAAFLKKEGYDYTEVELTA